MKSKTLRSCEGRSTTSLQTGDAAETLRTERWIRTLAARRCEGASRTRGYTSLQVAECLDVLLEGSGDVLTDNVEDAASRA